MLRVYFLQHWFKLSDPGAEDAPYESPALWRFAGVDLRRAAAPGETTILRFPHLLEEHELGGRILKGVISTREEGHPHPHHRGGTILDATIIAAPSSTKNQSVERDPEMHRTRKWKRYYFAVKARVHRGGFSGRHAHAARLNAWPGEEGLGQPWVSTPKRRLSARQLPTRRT
jgi:transposase, IS5 family